VNRLIPVLFLGLVAQVGQASELRSELGRYWIEFDSVSLEKVLREVAAISPMELWLDGSVSEKRVSVRVEGLSLRQALSKLLESSGSNFVLYFDPTDGEKVVKLYAGTSDAGRLAPTPTVDTVAGPSADETSPQMHPELADWIFHLHPDDAAASVEDDGEALRDFLQLLADERGLEDPVDASEPEDNEETTDEAAPEAIPTALSDFLSAMPQLPAKPHDPTKAPRENPPNPLQ
jgi:hypothetical protein